MNRRTFLATALFAVAASRTAIATTPVATPETATRAFETIDPATADPERILARVDRLMATSPPFPATIDELVELGHFEYFGAIRGEYWVGEFEAVPAPDDLPSPAMVVDFDSSAGITGFREEHTLGMVDSNGFRWTFQATGGDRDERIRIVVALARLTRERLSGGTPSSTPAALENLLPAPDDFPLPVRLSEEPQAR